MKVEFKSLLKRRKDKAINVLVVFFFVLYRSEPVSLRS